MDIVVRASVIYILLWAITRGMGKRELSEISPFDLILVVIMGDLIQQGVTQDDRSITGAAIAVATITIWVIGMSYASFRSQRVSNVTSGLPVVIVRDGQLLEDFFPHERLRFDDVAEEARNQGISDLRKVRVGILEADGNMSFVLDDSEATAPPRQGKHAERRLD
jgi:uncharacterized membrane protein YcaP (DUF421 family)